MLNAKAKLAHMCAPSDGIEMAELTPVGIYVKTTRGSEHMIPFANVQSIHLHEANAYVAERLEPETRERLKPGPKPKAV